MDAELGASVAHSGQYLWRAVLTPNRSLDRNGFCKVIVFTAFVSCIVTIGFASLGAWPVGAFAGLELALLWYAMHSCLQREEGEQIAVTAHEVIIHRVGPGRTESATRLVRQWVRVELEYGRNGEYAGNLYLRSGDIRLNVGAFLTASERNALAAELHRALAKPGS